MSDTDISGNSWNSSPFLSMVQQRANGFYPPTVGQVSLPFTWVYWAVDLDAHLGGHDSEYVRSPTGAFSESPPTTLTVRRGPCNNTRIQDTIENLWISDLSG